MWEQFPEGRGAEVEDRLSLMEDMRAFRSRAKLENRERVRWEVKLG